MKIVIMGFVKVALIVLSAIWYPSETSGRPVVTDSLASKNFIHVHGGLSNFFYRLKHEGKVTVAFLGGSITAGKGWRDHVEEFLIKRYPEAEFTFINAGIPSLGSVPHAFRFEEDVLRNGRIDLLFVESAVNDLANGTPVDVQRRALEGIVRHALSAQPTMNIVVMAFADEPKNADYASGNVPAEVNVHAEVAVHYKLPFVNLAMEVYARIAAGEFSWKEDFIDLHPSPFGHQLYFRTIRTLLELAEDRAASRLRSAKIPKPMNADCFDKGQYVAVESAEIIRGFALDPAWEPDDQAKTRKRFVQIPMLVATDAGSTAELSFTGNAVGIAVLSGPDAGIINYSIDNGPSQVVDLYTQWSKSLHLPWYLVLADGLRNKTHRLRITLLDDRHDGACRIAYFLVNTPK